MQRGQLAVRLARSHDLPFLCRRTCPDSYQRSAVSCLMEMLPKARVALRHLLPRHAHGGTPSSTCSYAVGCGSGIAYCHTVPMLRWHRTLPRTYRSCVRSTLQVQGDSHLRGGTLASCHSDRSLSRCAARTHGEATQLLPLLRRNIRNSKHEELHLTDHLY